MSSARSILSPFFWVIAAIGFLCRLLLIVWATLAIYYSNLPWPVARLALAKRTKHEVTRIIAGAGVPCGAVLTTLELPHDPDLHKRGMMQTIEHPARGPVIVPGWPLRMSDSKVPLKCAPILGADSEAIYGEWLGCSPGEVRDMRQAKVI